MRSSGARLVAVVAALVLSACASVAAFESMPGEHGGGSTHAVASGVPPAISPLTLSRLDAASDAARLVRTARTRGPRLAALAGFGVCLFLAAARRSAVGARHGAWRQALLGLASSRAPPRQAVTLS